MGYFFSRKGVHLSIKKYLPLLGVCLITSFILLEQPDFGLTMTLLATTCTLFFITQPNNMYIIGLFGTVGISAITLILMQPYRIQRIATFLDPWKDPKGKGFQIIQSFIAIGSGGWLGNGIAHSKQKFFIYLCSIPILFSILAEETGFVGSCILILLLIGFIHFGMRIAQKLKDPYAAFTTLGFVILIGLQSLINIAVTTGLAPTKGIGLPLVSYGNTSLVCTLAMIGFIINMVHQDRWLLS
jgi:cell division protein FtsW